MTPSTHRRVVLLSSLTLICLCSAGVARAQTQDDTASIIAKGVRSIAITATDKIIHQADVATVHIGFELYGPDQPTAYASASTASNAIIAALRSAGVPSDAIESQQQSVIPVEPYQLNQLPASERASHTFIAQQSWTVRTTPVAVARLLDTAVKAGANKSGDIDWTLSDSNAASAEAAAKALQRAKVQAGAMATGLGVHLGQLLYASNQVQSEPIRPMPMAMGPTAMAAKAAPPPLAINPRQIETSATVYAVFAIE
jgi:hypothetical protein